MTLGSSLTSYQKSDTSFSEADIWSQFFQGMYSKEDHYRWIQPSEATSLQGAVTTVLKGIRPFAMIDDHPKNSAYILGLKKISGISIVHSPYKPKTYNVYRTGAEHLSEACAQVDKMMEERVAQEGSDNIKAYGRMLDSHKKYGEILYYEPKAIADFGVKIRQMLDDELRQADEGKEKENAA